jgi:hypothetical protein
MRSPSRAVPIALLAAGCFAPEIPPGGVCRAVCPLGEVCIDGACVDARDGDPSLVAHWRFDDPPDDGALDSSGHDHHASCTSCPTLVAGRIGGGYLFDDDDGHILVVPDDREDFRGLYTIAAWVYPDNTHDQIALLSKPFGTGTGNSWQLEMFDDDHVSLSGGAPHSLQSPGEIANEVWFHLAGTWDGETKRLYINGVEVAAEAATVEYDEQDIYLGGDLNGGAEALLWDGILDDLRVYRRALPADEVAGLAR